GARDQNERRLDALALEQEQNGGRARGRGAVTSATEQADNQGDLNRDIEGLFKQLQSLPKFLTPEQKDRLVNSKATEKRKRVQDGQALAAKLLGQGDPKAAAQHQQKASDLLLELAHALRAPKDKLETLKEARAKLDKALQAQEKLAEETAAPPPLLGRARVSQYDATVRHARDMASKQARIEFDAKDTRDFVKDIAKEAADTVKKAEGEMQKAQDELAKANNNLDKAIPPQEKAADELKNARDNLDDLIAKEEKKRSDPLEAVKDAIGKVDDLIKDETKAR